MIRTELCGSLGERVTRVPLCDYSRVDLNPGVGRYSQKEKPLGLSLSWGSQKVDSRTKGLLQAVQVSGICFTLATCSLRLFHRNIALIRRVGLETQMNLESLMMKANMVSSCQFLNRWLSQVFLTTCSCYRQIIINIKQAIQTKRNAFFSGTLKKHIHQFVLFFFRPRPRCATC